MAAKPNVTIRNEVSQKVMLTSRLLQLNTLEMEQAIREALEQNPALEWTPEGLEPATEALSTAPEDESFFSPIMGDDDEGDVLAYMAAPVSMYEYTLQQLSYVVPANLLPAAIYLVGFLDDRGYLSQTIDEITTELKEIAQDISLDFDPAQLSEAYGYFRQLEPTGLAAQNLQDSLLFQFWELTGSGNKSRKTGNRGKKNPFLPAGHLVDYTLVELVIKHHLEDLAGGRIVATAEALKVSKQELLHAWDFIRSQLSPYPAAGLSTDHSPAMSQPIAIEFEQSETTPRLLDGWDKVLQISPVYQETIKSNASNGLPLDLSDARLIKQQVARAKDFIEALKYRSKLLTELATRLLDPKTRQPRKLEREALCQDLGVHPSTLSRAINGKYVRLPSQKIMALADFFKSEETPREALNDLLNTEPPEEPYDDGKLADLLGQRGFSISRQMVSRYRQQLNVAPVQLRKNFYAMQNA